MKVEDRRLSTFFIHLYTMTSLFLFCVLLLTFNLSFSLTDPNPNPCDSTSLSNPQNLQPDKLTVVINGYSESRIPLLRSIITTYTSSSLVSSILIVWGNPSTPIKTLSDLSYNLSLLYSAGARITVLPQQSASLNSRFLPHDELIRTRAVLICDDDVQVSPKSLEFAFRIWQQNPTRLIGFFARSHDLDLINKTWIYTVHPDKYSIVLTKFMILSTGYLRLYSCGNGTADKYRGTRAVVDKMHNCEDILMNFVVADDAGEGPVLVAAEGLRDWGDPRNEGREDAGETEVGLSSTRRGRGEHRKRRGECIREFHKVLGRMPLRYSYGKVVNSVGEQGLCKKQGRLVPCDQQVE